MRSFLTAVKTFIIIRCMPEMGESTSLLLSSLPLFWLPLCVVITGEAISGMEMQACFMDKSPPKARDERVDQDHDNITNKVNNIQWENSVEYYRKHANYCRRTKEKFLTILSIYCTDLHKHEWEFSKCNWFPCKSHRILLWYINCLSSSEWTIVIVFFYSTNRISHVYCKSQGHLLDCN